MEHIDSIFRRIMNPFKREHEGVNYLRKLLTWWRTQEDPDALPPGFPGEERRRKDKE